MAYNRIRCYLCNVIRCKTIDCLEKEAVFKSINGGSFSNFTGGTTGHGLITYRISGGGTAWDHVNFMVYDTPNTTSSIIYKLYLSSNDNNQNVRIGENGAEEFMSAMEIRQ